MKIASREDDRDGEEYTTLPSWVSLPTGASKDSVTGANLRNSFQKGFQEAGSGDIEAQLWHKLCQLDSIQDLNFEEVVSIFFPIDASFRWGKWTGVMDIVDHVRLLLNCTVLST